MEQDADKNSSRVQDGTESGLRADGARWNSKIEVGVGSGQKSRVGSSSSCVSVMTDPHTGGPCSFLRELPRLASVRLASGEDGSEGSGQS